MSIITNQRGVTTSDSLKGRRKAECWTCGELSPLLTTDANGNPICSDCLAPRRQAPFAQEPEPDAPESD